MTVRILVVDDEPAVEELLSNFLRKYLEDYELISASNGEEAISIIENMNEMGTFPHLTLMDLKMPIMDGIESTTRLKGLGIENIYILTAFLEHDLISKAVAAGAKGIIKKSEGFNANAKKIADIVRSMRSEIE
jgi:CheY-like chemotaxis protein